MSIKLFGYTFGKAESKVEETKSHSNPGHENITLNQLLCGFMMGQRRGFVWLQALAAWRYYKQVGVVADGVNKAATSFVSIKPQLWDQKEKQFISMPDPSIPESQILALLNKPNTDQSGSKFRESSSKSYNVTGDIFLVGKAMNENRPFISLEYINPVDITIIPSTKTGGVGSYTIQSHASVNKFNRIELDNDIRFFTKDMRWELWHIKKFNPNESSINSPGDLFGMSPLNPIFLEIEQIISSNIHNWGTLENGARPSGAVTIDPDVAELTDDQFNRLRQQVKDFYQGTDNSGNILFLENGIKFMELSITNKDMDFANLLKIDKTQVANNLDIPLPLIQGDSQKFSNFTEAEAILYTTNIIPFARLFYDELWRFMGRRYERNDDMRFRLSFDIRDIPALEGVRIDAIKKKLSTNMYSYDEGRKLLDLDPLASGGDTVFQPSSFLPVGEVSTKNMPITKERFIHILKSNVDEDGNRKYSDDFIEKKVLKKYGDS